MDFMGQMKEFVFRVFIHLAILSLFSLSCSFSSLFLLIISPTFYSSPFPTYFSLQYNNYLNSYLSSIFLSCLSLSDCSQFCLSIFLSVGMSPFPFVFRLLRVFLQIFPLLSFPPGFPSVHLTTIIL